MASRRSRWVDEFEDDLVGQDSRRRRRSNRHRKSPRSPDFLDAAEKTRKRPGRVLGDKPRDGASRRGKRDMFADEHSDENEIYSPDLDEDVDLELSDILSIDDADDSEIEPRPEDWQ